MLLISFPTSRRPDTWLVSTPPTRSSPSSEASDSQVRGFNPSSLNEPRSPAFRIDAFAARLGGRLLVVDVLELDEGAVAGREEPVWTVCPPPSVPTLSSRSVEGSLPLLVRNGPLAWIRTGRSSLAALQLEARVDLQVGALYRLAEGLVEQVLDAALVALLAAGDQRERSEEEGGQQCGARGQGRAFAAGQGPWPKAAWLRNSGPMPTLDRGCVTDDAGC